MSAIGNLPIGCKLVFAFGIVRVLCLSLGLYTFLTFWSIHRSSVDVSENGFPAFVALTEPVEPLTSSGSQTWHCCYVLQAVVRQLRSKSAGRRSKTTRPP